MLSLVNFHFFNLFFQLIFSIHSSVEVLQARRVVPEDPAPDQREGGAAQGGRVQGQGPRAKAACMHVQSSAEWRDQHGGLQQN